MSDATPTELQIALFAALEDLHDLSSAIVVILVDEAGTTVAVSGDDAEIPADLRAVLSGAALARAGSARVLLEGVDLSASSLNIAIFAPAGMLLAIVFDAEADFATVQTLGKQASDLIAELLSETAS